MCYEDFEFYEQSATEVLLDEIKDKLVECLTQEIKDELDNLKNENQTLKAKNEKLRNELSKLEREKANGEWDKERIRKEVEEDFYAKNVDEIFKSRIENIDLWCSANTHYEIPKCNYCDENRNRVFKFEDGFELKQRCDCDKGGYRYEPRQTTFDVLTYCIDKKNRKLYVKDWKLYHSVYDADYYGNFKVAYILDYFDENAIKIHKEKRYDEQIGFKTKEECQKYCDWLNEQK